MGHKFYSELMKILMQENGGEKSRSKEDNLPSAANEMQRQHQQIDCDVAD